MAGSNDNSLSTIDIGANFVAHFGVKGMKWGVRKEVKSAIKDAYKPSHDAVRSFHYMNKAKIGGVRTLNNQEMRHVITRMQLERQYKELYGERQWHNAGKKWAANFVNDVLKDVASSWLRNPFASKNRDTGPINVQSWTTGQNFAGSIQNSRRAIGS